MAKEALTAEGAVCARMPQPPAWLIGESRLVRIAQGESLLRSGDSLKYVYIVRSGKIMIFSTGENGQESKVVMVPEGGIVGEMEAIAGVERIVCVTPPTKDGTLDSAILAACQIAGITEIYTVGGAQAIAALAYGTESIAPVDKITGPGNAFVAAAKKIVSGDVGIDMIAGPSEVCVVADEQADPRMVAIDLMAQAEHDPLAACYLVCFSEEYVDAVEAAVEEHMKESPRAEITRTSLNDHGLAVVVADRSAAMQAVNVIAPEHLELHVANPMDLLGAVKNAGAIFLGEWTAEAVGDYVAGPNHTLPTGGTARFSSPLSVDEFVKKSSIIQYSPEALAADADAIITIAHHEGLWAHAHSVELRRDLLS